MGGGAAACLDFAGVCAAWAEAAARASLPAAGALADSVCFACAAEGAMPGVACAAVVPVPGSDVDGSCDCAGAGSNAASAPGVAAPMEARPLLLRCDDCEALPVSDGTSVASKLSDRLAASKRLDRTTPEPDMLVGCRS